MPRPNPTRSIASEAALAARIAYVRKDRGLGVDALAKLMTAEGCAITGSAIFRIEKGDPPRKITVDELIALSRVFDMEPSELLVPLELVQQKRAQEIAAELPAAFAAYDQAIRTGLRLYLEYGRLAAESPELLDFMNFQAESGFDRLRHTEEEEGVELGDHISAEEVAALQRDAVRLWGKVLALASKAARPATEVEG